MNPTQCQAPSNPLVTAVVLNWNGGEDTIRCIEHVQRQSYEPIEIVVVDNGSSDGSKDAVRSRFPDIELVENQRNLGFATGMNQGIELAKGQYVVLLNQDACLRADYVQTAVHRMKSAPPNVGSLAANVFKLENGTKTHYQIGKGILLRKRFQVTVDPDSNTEHYTFSPTWCCPFLTKAMLDDVKEHSKHCFDDGYFAFGEDVDLALRAQLRGWKCLFVPDLVAWHTQSGSLGGKVRIWEKPSVFRAYSLRNRYSTIIKDLPVGLLVRLAPFLVLAELLTWPYFLIRSPSTILCLIRAYAETICHLPETLHARTGIQKSRSVSAAYLWQFFHGF